MTGSRFRSVFLATLSAVSFFAGRPDAVLALDAAAVEAPDQQSSAKYLRYVEDPAKPRLETSVVRFRNDKGATVDLIGAVHVGDPAYFAELNRTFKDYDVVLYEMVKPKGMNMPKPHAQKPAGEGGGGGDLQMRFIHGMQQMMQESLDLKYQLDEIDYSAANFVHADLDSDTFLEMQRERGETMFTLMLNAMLKELMNPREPSANAPGIMDLIDALSSPNRARALKMVVARQFSDMDRSMLAMEGSVIIEERNHHALKVLKEQLDAGQTKLAIYYGAGHFSSMEKQLVDLMGFKQVGEPRWITAWDLSEAGPKPVESEKAPATQPVH
ncbi:MAG: hypothetical protein QM770_09940 [Tepidisphaeraceae bacterium]